MTNRLADAISPYLRSHADNPVDWYPWGPEAFAEAARRDVPVLVSIGYSTCHWCHVMARESFSDPELARGLNARFVAIKVDREEHPDVDASYLAAAGVFTPNLGWPLNVFVTPAGRAFFAGTYFPPTPLPGHPSFTQVLDAVSDAWTERRDEVESNAAQVAEALAAAGAAAGPQGGASDSGLPDAAALDRAVAALAGYEDASFGGFGSAPKFPVAPVLAFLLEHGTDSTDSTDSHAGALAGRTLTAMARSPLRDPIEGGFFRYATRRDWSEPHYERMLYDNAQLLDAYTMLWRADRSDDAAATAAGIAAFLTGVLQRPSGGFASAQDSESTVDGKRVEGGYYALDADARARQHPPALDEKVLTGWNGLAIAALARAGFAFARDDWVAAARLAADHLLARHVRDDGTLIRASIGDRFSDAAATLEDYGMFADGLLALALASGEVRYAQRARRLVDSTIEAATDAAGPEPGTASVPFGVPGGADAVLAAQGLAIAADPSEGAYPSGLTAVAGAGHTLYLLTAESRYLLAARATMARVATSALAQPIAFGGALRVMSALARPIRQLVVVLPQGPAPDEVAAGPRPSLIDVARRSRGVVVVVTESQGRAFADAGFELFAGRGIRDGMPTAYLCRDFVCRLPVTNVDELSALQPPAVE